MASVLLVAPVSLELIGSPPRVYSSPPQVCTEPLQSQQSFARDSHPTGGTITRGFQHCWEEFSPNQITIHKEPVCRHDALLPVVSSNFASCQMKIPPKNMRKRNLRSFRWKPPVGKKTVCELCLKNYSKRPQFEALLNFEKSPYPFFFGIYCLK